MKTFQTFALSALALATLASSASALTTIRIVASNGDRVNTQRAISKLLKAGWTYRGNGVNGPGTATQAESSNFGAWRGYYPSSAASTPENEYIIKVSYSGALAGVEAIAGHTNQRFVASTGLATDAPVGGSLPNPLTSTNGAEFEFTTADFGFSTNFQSTSPFSGTYNGVTYGTVIEEIVGVSPLGFYASPGFPGSPVNTFGPGYQVADNYKPNITTQLAQLLYTTGSVTLAQFTGDFNSHSNYRVYAIGRNTDAGQRFGALGEIGLGTTTAVRVYFPTITGTTSTNNYARGGTADSHQLWPVSEQQGQLAVTEVGNGGYNTGAALAPVLTARLGVNAYRNRYYDPDLNDGDGGFAFQYNSAVGGFYIGYLTPGDANSRVLGTSGSNAIADNDKGVALRYNGVELTDANVQNGLYTAWLYNRLLRPQGGITDATISSFADALRDQIKNVDAVASGLFDNATFRVKRSTDGGLVVPK